MNSLRWSKFESSELLSTGNESDSLLHSKNSKKFQHSKFRQNVAKRPRYTNCSNGAISINFFSIRKNLNKMRTNRMYKNVTEMLQESVLSMLLSRVTVVKLNSKEASLDILCCIVLYLPNRITGSPKSYFIYKGQNALGISHEFFIQFNFQLSFISFRFVSFHLHANIHMWRYIEL